MKLLSILVLLAGMKATGLAAEPFVVNAKIDSFPDYGADLLIELNSSSAQVEENEELWIVIVNGRGEPWLQRGGDVTYANRRIIGVSGDDPNFFPAELFVASVSVDEVRRITLAWVNNLFPTLNYRSFRVASNKCSWSELKLPPVCN